MYFDKLSSNEKVIYLLKPILMVLQQTGGQMDRSDIKDKICAKDEKIAEYSTKTMKSKSTGNRYKPFDFKFNFAIKDLAVCGYLTFTKGNPTISLSNKGFNTDISTVDGNAIVEQAKDYWEKAKGKHKKHDEDTDSESSDDSDVSKYDDEFKEKLLTAISKMSPKKFEQFSRLLLHKMGVEFTEKGVQISCDGGIDGYGYHMDDDDFRTTRVVIQCKRYNTAPVREPEINQFLGAMGKNNADYGVFLTNGRFTAAAVSASREGSPITLIDGNELVKLVKKYELYISPVKAYVLDDFYDNED